MSLSDEDQKRVFVDFEFAYQKAVEATLSRPGSQTGSTSYVQRSLKIGYNRAALLMERMEAEGVLSRRITRVNARFYVNRGSFSEGLRHSVDLRLMS